MSAAVPLLLLWLLYFLVLRILLLLHLLLLLLHLLLLLLLLQGRLGQLEHLGLDLNPVASLPDYREKVFALVPSLLVLDSRDRQGEEREAADTDSDEEEEGEINIFK